jgi:hypothetical protein
MRSLNRKESELIKEIKQKNDNELINIISLLNNHRNFMEFDKDGIDLEVILSYLCKEAINRDLRIETKGYIDLIPIINKLK